MTLEELNKLPEQEFLETMSKCCGSSHWGREMFASRPFKDFEKLLSTADEAWQLTKDEDWLEAFSHHPKIGDLKNLEKKFASTKELAGGEQASVKTASQFILQELANKNSEYENKFGFIFIVCATGKSAEEMLELLKLRLGNSRDEELKIAAGEQHKITKLRLQNIFS